ncbi:putative Zn-dependent peptidase [Salsuginibacillus halophilus]|uniref:Putative Zn-dependent peptidase n=1 Tax=Salsuginibacillus halophilus TaxID=517424 RepID=A0A2P8HYE7_9BACI|nr:pitrilysin family protein [Salsuginibacillus halophilus]PSL51239.1 putative Zn-dependent peptidase [Salsuginibacillus halophilus]
MIERHQLKNGLRVVSEHIPHVRSVSIGVWVGTGSRYETSQNNGISHFLEHMFFKGTNRRTPQDIAEEFDQIGGHVNAFTSKEATCFYAKVLDEHAGQALDILSDMFFNSTFDPEELEKEQGVVLEEIKMVEDMPDDIVHDYLGEAAYRNHALGRPILGAEETVLSFQQQDLINYLEEHYTAENVVISVAGNISNELLEEIKQIFSAVKTKGYQKALAPAPFYTDQSAYAKQTEQAHICFGFPGLATGSDRMYSLVLLNNYIGGSMSSRLFQEIREQRGLAYSVFSYHAAFQDSGMMTIYAGTNPDQLNEVVEASLQTIEDVKAEGMTDEQLRKGKEQLKGNLMLSLESTNSRMSRNGKNELMLGFHRDYETMLSLIQEVTPADVKQMAREIFQTNEFPAALISPSGEMPDALRR